MSTENLPYWDPIEGPKHCFYQFLEDPEYGHYLMKWRISNKLTASQPFLSPDGIVEWVFLNEFLAIERDRLPIFLGSQFGIHPPYNVLEPIPDGHLHFIISKSMLSGCVNGLHLKRWDAESQKFVTIKFWAGHTSATKFQRPII